MILCVVRSLGQTCWPSIWCSKYFAEFFAKISFEGPKSTRNHKRDNAWNIRRLVNESFVPPSQQTSILYCRLSDFKSNNKLLLKLHVDITQSSSNSLTQPASFLFALTYCQILRWAMFKQIKPFTALGMDEFSVNYGKSRLKLSHWMEK